VAYVLDASAAVDLLLETSAGALLRPKLPAGEAWVPELFFPEVGSAIRRLEMYGSITMARADSAVGDLPDARLRRVDVATITV
jgi:predicted nucleic acid-binding protein